MITALCLALFAAWFVAIFRPARQARRLTNTVMACQAAGLHTEAATPGRRDTRCPACGITTSQWSAL